MIDFSGQDASLDDQLPDIPANYDTIAAPQQTGPYLTLDPLRQMYDGLQPQAGQVYDEIDENRDTNT